ncbi:anti-sigma factor family protein [Rhodopirellula sallentina]|uniref:Protein containing DUF1559 n=1 Tax=Rhodopirellula sallentina SM41 TaxID=1263870 RepID=M5TYD3_9BACT|nr:hypothetical protein [Rhodopirellula sallentina]EMI54212.1 hypothetical protein RSSM_04364 [Rhodopirellula sallentina SM41]
MQEDLLGYLLGALEPDEMRRVEQWLREDADARRELAELEQLLERLEEADEPDDVPPADLVSRTLANLPPLPPPVDPEDTADEFSGNDDFAGLDDTVRWQTVDESTYHAATNRNRPGGQASSDQAGSDQAESDQAESDYRGKTAYGELTLSESNEKGRDSSWTLRDWGASITAAAILVAISIPPLIEGRFAARKAACQDHLRQLGVAMTSFANRNAQSRLPSVAPDGYQAFAGVYAPRLHEAGLLSSPLTTLCPSIDRDQLLATSWTPAFSPELSEDDAGVPTMVTLRMLDDVERDLTLASEEALRDEAATNLMVRALERLRWFQMTAGGHYAYTLGVRDGEHFTSPRFQGRSQFAVMSDAAITRANVARDNHSSQPAYRMTLMSHGGRGINVLYEDGHVGFLPSESLDTIPDNPLINHDGLIEAGVTIDDATLAPSWQPPFIRANQR